MAQEREKGPFEQIGETVGGAVGKAAGRANDLAMNAVGSAIGALLQGMGAWWSSPDAEQASRAFDDRTDRACREHFSSTRRGGSGRMPDYESARPLYQFGYMAGRNPEYQSKPFDQVEADLERAWERVGRDRFGAWQEVREQVGFGYTHREPGAPNPT